MSQSQFDFIQKKLVLTLSSDLSSPRLAIIEYTDDHTIVPRSTSVLAQRLPPMKAGRGNAQFYMAAALGAVSSGNERNGVAGGNQSAWRDKGSMSKRFDGREDVKPVIQVSSFALLLSLRILLACPGSSSPMSMYLFYAKFDV
jgi:hypothetical protein